MTRLRRAVALLFFVGVATATLTDRVAHAPRQRDGLWILAADFHVHSFLGDGALPPWELAREAARRGLDVIAVTNHNNLAAPRLASRLSGMNGDVLVLTAEELTAPSYHISAVGIREPIDWRFSTARAIDAIHAQGGVAIASHPIGAYARGYDDEALARLDGIEVAHPAGDFDEDARRELDAFYAKGLMKNPRLAPIGSSDFHFVQPMGLARTYVLATAFSETGVLDAVREGRTVAYDVAGNAYGDPALVQMVEAQRQQSSALRSDTGLKTVGTLMSWASLLLAVAIGPRLRRPRS
jgi:hypothetical protein